jgi:hypothetical protein
MLSSRRITGPSKWIMNRISTMPLMPAENGTLAGGCSRGITS